MLQINLRETNLYKLLSIVLRNYLCNIFQISPGLAIDVELMKYPFNDSFKNCTNSQLQIERFFGRFFMVTDSICHFIV